MLELLFPKECLMCAKTGSWLCKKCEKKLVHTLPNCYICKTLSNKYDTHHLCLKDNTVDQITTIWKYNEYGKKLIHSYKYKHRFKVGDFIFSLFEEKLQHFNFQKTVLIPIPSYTVKTLERGFNPTEIITELIASKYKVDVNKKVLLKTESNQSQASLEYTQREKNVEGIFEVNQKEVPSLNKYTTIVLIDDIITTGATIKEVNKTLRGFVKKDVKIKALCIFQGNFKKNEPKKHLQPSQKKGEKV